jgi:curved DNA-binding protein CbpA
MGQPNDDHDPYSVLGVPPTASTADIRQAYQQAALQCHPDKRHGKNDHDRIECHEQFTKLNSAYELLSNPLQRQMYDQTHSLDASAAMAHPPFHHPLVDLIFREEFRDNVFGQMERRRTTRDVMNRPNIVEDCDDLFRRNGGFFGGSLSRRFTEMPKLLDELFRDHEERMKRVHEDMEQPFGDLSRGYTTSSSTSTRIFRNADGEVVRTTEQMIQRNGQEPQTVTETVVTNKDGSVKERHVTGQEALLKANTNLEASKSSWWPTLWNDKSKDDKDKRWWW